MSDTVSAYVAAVVGRDVEALNSLVCSSLLVEPQPNPTITGPRRAPTRTAELADSIAFVGVEQSRDSWHALTFKGEIDGIAFEEVDIIHVGADGKIDCVSVIYKPEAAAEKFRHRMQNALTEDPSRKPEQG